MEELDDVINVPREKVWAEAMLFACDVTNKSVTTSTDGGKCRRNYGLENSLLPIICDRLERWDTRDGACVNIRGRQKERNAYSWEFPANFPIGTVSVILVRTRNIVERQAVQWVDGHKKTGGDGTGSDDRSMKSAGDGTIVERGTPQLNV